MRVKPKKILISVLVLSITNIPVFAESLFRAGISENAYPIQPRSLFSSVRAKTIGDLVTILIDETTTASDDLKLDITQKTSVDDNFSALVNKLIPRSILPTLPKEVDDFGGTSTVGNKATSSRTAKFKDTVTTQVVQIMPNGNLLVQGRKTALNAGEKVDIIVSGIVDPRLLDSSGSIKSTLVANLQLAVVGKGTISRSDSEGVVNKFIRYLF